MSTNIFRFPSKSAASPGSAIVLFLKRKKSWVTISFLLTYKFAYYMAMAPISFFLNKHLGFTVSEIAAVSKPATLVCFWQCGRQCYDAKVAVVSILIYFGFLELMSNLVYAYILLGKYNFDGSGFFYC